MKVNGDEFLRNLQKEQSKNAKQQESNNSAHLQESLDNYYNNINENPINNNDQELDDIRLNNQSNNKQKYILFGLSLVLLFLITIVTLRLLSEDKTKNNFTDNNLIVEDKKYDFAKTQNKSLDKSLDIEKIVQAEENIKTQPQEEKQEETQKQTSDIFGLEKETTQNTPKETVIKEIVKPKKENLTPKEKVVQKTVIINDPVQEEKLEKEQKTNSAPIPKDVIGTYIQVGAFTKFPDKILLKKLKDGNYNFIIHKMEVKGKLYNKVLIGKYDSKNAAVKDIVKVKQNINPNAYILRIK